MKKSKEELKQTIVDMVQDEDIQIALLEDIEDSFDVPQETDTTELDELKAKYDDLKTKYKERFLKGSDETEDKKEEVKEEIDEPKEEEKVEKKDIFKTIDEKEE